jgi:hypothetical protein
VSSVIKGTMSEVSRLHGGYARDHSRKNYGIAQEEMSDSRAVRNGELCPKLCPRGAVIDPKPPPASQVDK